MEDDGESGKSGGLQRAEAWTPVRRVVLAGLFMLLSAVLGAVAQANLAPPVVVRELVLPSPAPAPALIFRREAWPADGNRIVEDMPAGSVLYFSASSFSYEGRACSESSSLCVLIDTFSGPRTAVIENVITGEGFVEGHTGWTALEELEDKFDAFWDGRNCSSEGCAYVHLFLFSDGQLKREWWLMAPLDG